MTNTGGATVDTAQLERDQAALIGELTQGNQQSWIPLLKILSEAFPQFAGTHVQRLLDDSKKENGKLAEQFNQQANDKIAAYRQELAQAHTQLQSATQRAAEAAAQLDVFREQVKQAMDITAKTAKMDQEFRTLSAKLREQQSEQDNVKWLSLVAEQLERYQKSCTQLQTDMIVELQKLAVKDQRQSMEVEGKKNLLSQQMEAAAALIQGLQQSL